MPGLHHVGYWVDDLAAAQARWEAELGVGPFQVIEHVPFDSFAVADGDHVRADVVFDDVEQESARLAGLGCALINTARSGPVTVAWHRGGPLFPHPIEVHQRNDAICGMHGRLAALAALRAEPGR
jgi:catechol 2,3-dioxygenase-like lactoylglutathione lyase family enzyme